MTDHLADQAQESPTPACPRCGKLSDRDHHSWNFRVRGETPMQRVDRSYVELLQEVRVAQTGVQIVLAFLLWLAYSPNFTGFGTSWRVLYVGGLVSGLAAAAFLIAPACCHRLIYGRRLKPELVRVANRLTICGLGCLLAAVGCVLALVIGPIAGGPVGAAVSATVIALFGSVWYVLPVILRSRHKPDCPDCDTSTRYAA